MKPILNALSNIWVMLGFVFFASVAVLVLKWTGDGVTVLRPWLWGFLALLSVLGVAFSLGFKKPRFLILIPLCAFLTFLAGGLSLNLGAVQPASLVDDSQVSESKEPRKVSDVANGILSKFFSK